MISTNDFAAAGASLHASAGDGALFQLLRDGAVETETFGKKQSAIAARPPMVGKMSFGHDLAHGRAAEGRRGRIMSKKHLALYGLKWNPFAPDVPVEALHVTPRTQSFCWRVEQLAQEGGFALVTGAPGTGKSVTLRILA